MTIVLLRTITGGMGQKSLFNLVPSSLECTQPAVHAGKMVTQRQPEDITS